MGRGRPVSLVAAVAFSLAGAAATVAVAGAAGPSVASQPAAARPAGPVGAAPSSSPAARWLGIALELLARGRTEAALAPLEQARQADPDNLEASVLLASARLALQEPERALAALPAGSRASLSSQEGALVQTLRGMAHQRLGQAEAAVGAYRRAVEADGRTALAWVGLGQLARQAAADPAGPANQWGWPAKPASPTPRAWLELSEQFLRRAAQEASETVEVRLELARTQMELGRLNDALESLQRANRLDPLRPEVHFLLGSLWERQGRWTEAAAEYRRTLELDPNHEQARSRLQRLRPQSP